MSSAFGSPHAASRTTLVIRLAVSLCVAFAACDSPSSPSPFDFDSPLSENALLAHLNTLAADSMLGRLAGSEQERGAAEYIRSRFIEYGLQPSGVDYRQTFPVSGIGTASAQLSSQNVLGILPGSGSLAGQWVILGAHYDHVGWEQAPSGSAVVFNGADDNASGTALMLEVARALSEAVTNGEIESADRRSIMFQAFGAEEMGLVGSDYFCAQPTVPMDSIVAMLNMDMVGRMKDNTLVLVGASSSPDWSDLISDANRSALSFFQDEQLMRRSDQSCFYDSGKPVLLLHTGLHAEYHTPLDDVDLINRRDMLRVGALAIELLADLATRADPPAFTEAEEPQQRLAPAAALRDVNNRTK